MTFERLSVEYDVCEKTSPNVNGFMPDNTEPEYPEIGNDKFRFPPENKKSQEWRCIGYVTAASNTCQSVYKLHERYNPVKYVYEYLVLLEGGVFVQLESRDNRIRNNTKLSNGCIKGKNGPHEVTIY